MILIGEIINNFNYMNEEVKVGGEVGKTCEGAHCGGCKKCCCPHHRVISIVAILIALDFLLVAFKVYSIDTAQIIWPIIVIVAVIFKMITRRCKCC